MFTLYQKDTRTDRERYLEDELDREREQQQCKDDRREQERKAREETRHQEWDYEYRQASDWPDALEKQIYLCSREVREGEDETVDNFFGNTVAACEKALELWPEVASSKQAEIEELEKKIAAIRDDIRLEVAEKLTAFDPRREFAQLAAQIHDNLLEGFLDW
jgi:hypothetical protein